MEFNFMMGIILSLVLNVTLGCAGIKKVELTSLPENENYKKILELALTKSAPGMKYDVTEYTGPNGPVFIADLIHPPINQEQHYISLQKSDSLNCHGDTPYYDLQTMAGPAGPTSSLFTLEFCAGTDGLILKTGLANLSTLSQYIQAVREELSPRYMKAI